MLRLSKIVFYITTALLLVTSCNDGPKFDDKPFIEWRSAVYEIDPSTNNSKVIMTTYFTDGDGDVGREKSNFNCENNYNLFIGDFDMYIRYYEKLSGTFVEVFPVDSCLPFHNYLPNLTPQGQNKTLEGEVELRFNYTGLPQNAGVDSVKFELVLQDRSGKRSNIAFSPAVFIPQ